MKDHIDISIHVNPKHGPSDALSLWPFSTSPDTGTASQSPVRTPMSRERVKGLIPNRETRRRQVSGPPSGRAESGWKGGRVRWFR